MIKLHSTDQADLINLGIIEIRMIVLEEEGWGPALMLQRFDGKWFWADEFAPDGDEGEIHQPGTKEGVVIWRSPVRLAKHA